MKRTIVSPDAITRMKDNLSIVENGDVATQAIASGEFVNWKGTMCVANAAIAVGGALSGKLTEISKGALNSLNGKFGAIQHIGQYTGNSFSFNMGGRQKCLIVSIVGGNGNNTSGVITFVGRYYTNIFSKTIIAHNATHTVTQNNNTISVALAGQDGDYERVSDVYLI